jgi:hypothetical protein
MYSSGIKSELTSGSGWEPICLNSDESFYGTFDGNNCEISGLYIDFAVEEENEWYYIGFFAYNNGIIENLTISGNVSGTVCSASGIQIAGLVGYNVGMIYNCTNKAYILTKVGADSWYCDTGGLVAESGGQIINSSNSGTVTVIGSMSHSGAYPSASGIVSYLNGGKITNCYNTGEISASNGENIYLGGIIGYTYAATVDTCYNTGKISVSDAEYAYVGGVTGDQYYASVTASYNTGKVSASNAYVAYIGGISGENNDSSVNTSYNTGNVSVSDAEWANVGGISGENNDSSVDTCYNTGKISVSDAEYAYVGGVTGDQYYASVNTSYNAGDISVNDIGSVGIGGIVGWNDRATVEKCYNTGNINIDNVETGGAYIGGIIGYNDTYEDNGAVKECYNLGTISISGENTDEVIKGGIIGYEKYMKTVANNYDGTGIGAIEGQDYAGIAESVSGLTVSRIKTYIKNGTYPESTSN